MLEIGKTTTEDRRERKKTKTTKNKRCKHKYADYICFVLKSDVPTETKAGRTFRNRQKRKTLTL